jgi:hypothetical protein
MVLHVAKPYVSNQCKTEDDIEELKPEVADMKKELQPHMDSENGNVSNPYI